MSSLEGYKEWLGDRPNNMETRKEYNALMNGPVVGQDGVYHAGTGERYTEAELEELEKNNPYRPMLGKPDENGIRPGSPGRPGYDGPYGGSNSGLSYGGSNSYLQAQRAAQQAKIDAAVAQLEGQRYTIEQNAKAAAKQAFINKMLAEKKLPQQMAASGYSGGLTDTAILSQNTDYENSRNSIVNNRDAALNELNTNIAQTKATGDISIAEMESQYQLMLQQQLAEQQARQQELENQKNLLEYEYQLKDQYDRSSGAGGTGSANSLKNYYNRILETPKIKTITDRIQNQYNQYGVKYSDEALEYDLQSLYNGGFITGDELGALAYLYNIPVK